jgi:hypothetical protein
LSKLKSLRYVDLGACDLTNDGLSLLRKCERLEELHVSHNRINQNPLIEIASNRRLVSVSVVGTDVDDSISELLRVSPALKELSLSATKVTKKGYDRMRRQFPKVEIEWEP